MIIISQGLLVDPEKIDNSWPVPVLHSTWQGQKEWPNTIYSQPSDPGHLNVGLQRQSTLAGLYEAKKMGFTKAFKFRSDMYPSNGEKLLQSQKEGLNFIFWHNWSGGYYVDYCMSGPIDDLIKIWSFEKNDTFAERLLTDSVNQSTIDKINFFGSELSNENDIYWSKREIWLSTYKNDKLYKCTTI